MHSGGEHTYFDETNFPITLVLHFRTILSIKILTFSIQKSYFNGRCDTRKYLEMNNESYLKIYLIHVRYVSVDF